MAMSLTLNTYDNIFEPRPDTPPDLTIKYIDLPPTVIEAIRRVMGRWPHWVKYWSSPGSPPGTNDRTASKGTRGDRHKDRHGYNRAAYWTEENIDARKLACAFWTRDGNLHTALYAFADADFEPRRYSKKARTFSTIKQPTPKQRRATYLAALRYYEAWRVMATWHLYNQTGERYPDLPACEIISVLFMESSPDHYHVVTLFDRPLTEAEHAQAVQAAHQEAYNGHPPPRHLDKDSRRGKGHYGDAFRAPGTWKRGVKTRYIKYYVKDRNNQVLLDLAQSIKRGVRTAQPHPVPTLDRQTLLETLINKYPIVQGCRNHQQGRAIAYMKAHGVPPDQALAIGPAYLANATMNATREDAESRWKDAVNSVYKHLPPPQAAMNYTDFIATYRLTADESATIHSILQMVCLSPIREINIPSAAGLDNNQSHATLLVEAILIQLQINRQKDQISTARFTHAQLLEIVRLRHGVEIHPVKFATRFKPKYFTYVGADGKVHPATRLELLKEISKGTPGMPSEYSVNPILITPPPPTV